MFCLSLMSMATDAAPVVKLTELVLRPGYSVSFPEGKRDV